MYSVRIVAQRGKFGVQVFLMISPAKRVVGCLAAEKIRTAFPVIGGQVVILSCRNLLHKV